MKKTIKVFLGVLISALVLGLASCQQANGPQDVKLVDQVTQMHTHVYSVTGTITPSGTTTPLDATGDVWINWSSNIGSDTNYTSYSFSGSVYYKLTSTATNYSYLNLNNSIGSIYKISGKYYMFTSSNGKSELVDISSNITGSIDGSSFTFTSPVSSSSYGINLTFTRR